MGAVDLVLQVESPKSVARGLQRIGRAGHGVGDISKGRIFPKFRADLLESAVVVKLMREGKIEPTVVPRNALDVLAQQIVAIAAAAEQGEDGTVSVDDLYALVTRTHSYAELPRPLLENVLDMLDGRYPSAEFGELRPRIVWDRVAGTIRARKGARQLAIANAGTIPDRGLLLGDAARRPPRRRARRGDGLRGTAGPDVPARRLVVADRGDRPRPRGRHPRARRPGRGALLEGRQRRPAEGARPRARRVRPLGGRPVRRDARARVRPRRARRAQPPGLPRRAAGRHPRGAVGSHDRRRALPRRDRRLAAVRALAVRRPRACGMGPRAVEAHPGRAGPRVRRDLVRRRDHRPPSRRRRAGWVGCNRPRAARSRRGRGRRRLRARRQRPVRRALPRERGPSAADPARVAGPAHAAVAAAAEVPDAARGRQALRGFPDHPGDLSRVPARRPRPARPGRAAERPAPPRAVAGRGRDGDSFAVRLLAALRLRRDLHVRGRHAQRRAARRRAVARSRAAARAARPGGAARADRRRRPRPGRGRPPASVGPHARRDARRARRRAAAPRRFESGRGR